MGWRNNKALLFFMFSIPQIKYTSLWKNTDINIEYWAIFDCFVMKAFDAVHVLFSMPSAKQ